MTDVHDLERKFWKAIDHDRTVMLGVTGIAPRPMTALAEGDQAPMWFFTAAGTDLAQGLVGSLGKQATATISSKDHGLFATVSGKIVIDNDPAVIDRLWNPFIAAWFEGGKDDPQLRLLRMDPDDAHVWLNENSLLAGVKLMLGVDPKQAYESKTGDIPIA